MKLPREAAPQAAQTQHTPALGLSQGAGRSGGRRARSCSTQAAVAEVTQPDTELSSEAAWVVL